MREHRLQGAHLRRGRKHGSTRQDPTHTAAPDLVDRQFSADAPNQLWVADLTRLVTGEGVLWLASVRDAFANLRTPAWVQTPRASAHAVRDGTLITGQQQYSGAAAARLVGLLAAAAAADLLGGLTDSDAALGRGLSASVIRPLTDVVTAAGGRARGAPPSDGSTPVADRLWELAQTATGLRARAGGPAELLEATAALHVEGEDLGSAGGGLVEQPPQALL